MSMYRVGRGARLWSLLALAACALVTVSGCGSSKPAAAAGTTGGGQIVVLAAASLSGAFDTIGDQFEKAHPGTTVKFSYAGSSSLATQITQGTPADVFASADTKNMDIVTKADLATGTPVTFAHNTLEIVTEAGNPKHVAAVADLANPAIKVAVCAPAVPCGNYSTQVFAKAGITVKPVTEETSVTAVVTKVSLGEADAGVVYTTDVKAGGDKVAGVVIPPDQNVTADYPIVALKTTKNASTSTAFIDYVTSNAGQRVLASFGFLPAG